MLGKSGTRSESALTMTVDPKNMFSTADEEAGQLLAEIRELKLMVLDMSRKLNNMETRIKHKLPSAFNEDNHLAQMANDPEIQGEISVIKRRVYSCRNGWFSRSMSSQR